ncbi:transposase [Cucumis melo var. makuwa]|uniref:Transposase n=1 Tax=Cucumis melo var. makuwa TaxID=1194695 RepID=A0A5D3DU28_CUCMM|nr:transposase [Cucumis melo var. makuwa]
MKVLKNYVRNRHRPEGCIAESYIVEEAIEFCSDFLSGVDPIGLGIDRLDTSLDNSSFGRPLSAEVSFKLEQDLLYQAHRYVLANTIDVQPYIDVQVTSEIGMENVEISDNLRWIAHDPHPFVIKYNSYAINGCRYHTESYDKNRSVQNSGLQNNGVSLVAKSMQVCSSKDKNPTIGDMSFYGVIQDIWELNYNTFNVAVFRCDWVENNNDKFFTLKIQVMLDGQLCLLHHRENVKVNQMTMNLEIPCYIVKEYLVICQISWRIFSLHMEPTIVRDDQDKEVGGAEIDELVVGVVDEHAAFIIDSRSRKSILKTAGTTFTQFKHWLTKKYILPFKNELELLKRPPYMYSYIDQKEWEEFVRSRLCPHFEVKRKLQQERRKKNKYNHRLLRKGYANLREELKNIPSEESELNRASMWKKARVDKKGQYDNEDVQEVVNRIDEISKTCADKEPSPNDVLTQALGTQESSGRVRRVELENIHISTQSTPTSAHGSCSRPRLEYDIQCKKCLEKEVVKEEVNVDVIILNDLQEDAIECPLQVGLVECGYYVMRYMRDIITNGSIVVTDLIDTRTSYSQLELDEVRMEFADFLGGHM